MTGAYGMGADNIIEAEIVTRLLVSAKTRIFSGQSVEEAEVPLA